MIIRCDDVQQIRGIFGIPKAKINLDSKSSPLPVGDTLEHGLRQRKELILQRFFFYNFLELIKTPKKLPGFSSRCNKAIPDLAMVCSTIRSTDQSEIPARS